MGTPAIVPSPPTYDQGPLKGQPIVGMVRSGNVDVNHRPSIKNKDGSQSSIFSMTVPVAADGSPLPWPENGQKDPRIAGYALVPSIANGKFLTPDGQMPDQAHMGDLEDAATKYYAQTRQHLGVFTTPEAAESYAGANHDYGNDGTPTMVYAPSPARGSALWAQQGAVKANQHLSSNGLVPFSQQEIDNLQSTPSGRQLLVNTSDLSPGTPSMNAIVQQLHNTLYPVQPPSPPPVVRP